MSSKPLLFLSGLTHQPGVYQMLDKSGTVLYVGKARDLKKRLSSYFSSREKDIKTSRLLEHVADVTVTVTESEQAALLLECNLIKRLRPHYNVLFRDDKSYPYILLTEHTFPQITFYRGRSGRKKKLGGRMFGPFADVPAVRDMIHLTEKIFQVRNCSDSFFAARKRPCLQYQIGRCSAPCTGLISEKKYQEGVRGAELFLGGKNSEVIESLQSQMEVAAELLDFEAAAAFRDRIACVRDIQSRQIVSGKGNVSADVLGLAVGPGMACIQVLMLRNGRMLGSRAFFPEVRVLGAFEEMMSTFIVQRYLDPDFLEDDIPGLIVTGMRLPEAAGLAIALKEKKGHAVTLSEGKRGIRKKWLEMAVNSAKESIAAKTLSAARLEIQFETLSQWLDLPVPPQKIECIDISHTMGEAAVGSSVTMGPTGPMKNFYRRFNISGITPGDDAGAMRQLLQRRFAGVSMGAEARLPDILLVDGGVPQIHAVQQTMNELGLGSVPVIGVAKGVTRKAGFETLHLPDGKAVHLAPNSPALHLIQQVRDEAHRFAITGHRLKRDRRRTHSVLESIPGVGAKRRRELLRYFGGLQAITRASLDDLMQVSGINRVLAQQIYEVLHKKSS